MQRRSKELSQEHKDIFVKILRGKTYMQIAEAYEFTKQRSEQIFKKVLKLIQANKPEAYAECGLGDSNIRLEAIRFRAAKLIDIVGSMPVGKYPK